MKAKYIIFDLDDTLIPEIEFLKSAYKEIAEILQPGCVDVLYRLMLNKYTNGENVFDYLVLTYPNFSKKRLLDIYRNHIPNIMLDKETILLFEEIKAADFKIGLITDGRSVTQRNKIRALKIEHYFDKIIISEELGSSKPDINNFKIFYEDNIEEYFYIADNPHKDFISPNELGWRSICILDNGNNIHKQNFDVDKKYLPEFRMNSLQEIREIIFAK